MITREELAEIKRRADAATDGPWWVGLQEEVGVIPITMAGDFAWVDVATAQYFDNAEFIAHAREDIPRLVAEVERLQDTVDKLHEQLRKADENIDRIEFELAIVKGREAMNKVAERIVERAKNE